MHPDMQVLCQAMGFLDFRKKKRESTLSRAYKRGREDEVTVKLLHSFPTVT
jgi:hypothetical protein